MQRKGRKEQGAKKTERRISSTTIDDVSFASKMLVFYDTPFFAVKSFLQEVEGGRERERERELKVKRKNDIVK